MEACNLLPHSRKVKRRQALATVRGDAINFEETTFAVWPHSFIFSKQSVLGDANLALTSRAGRGEADCGGDGCFSWRGKDYHHKDRAAMHRGALGPYPQRIASRPIPYASSQKLQRMKR